MIRLIAIDLDGTLLNEEWKISRTNREAIRQAVAAGIKVTISTGRMAASARQYARELGLDVPIITYLGALVEQALSGEILYRKVISSELAAEVTEFLLKKGIYTQLFLKDRVFVHKSNAYSEYYRRLSGITVEEADFFKLLAEEPEGVEKILCMGDWPVLSKTIEELRETYSDRLYCAPSGERFFDIVHPAVNKGTALKALADRWGIKREEIMAIGDSFNDREMMEYAGLSVAMGNAHPEILKIADYITASNQEDGVAKAITKFVLDED